MAILKRGTLAVGALAVVTAVVLAIALKGWEFASWVSAAVGALSIAGGWLVHTRGQREQRLGDRIEQANINAGRAVIGKHGGKESSPDEITQREIRAGQDVIAKASDWPNN